MRLWNPTRIDPAYRPPRTTSTGNSAVSSQDYYRRQQQTESLHDEPSKLPQHLPSALPMQTYTEGHMHPIHSITVNSTSNVLLSSSDKTLVATDLVTAQVKQKWWGHGGRIECVSCLGGSSSGTSGSGGGGGGSTSEEVYATSSYDATVRLWDSRSRSKDPLMILEEAKDAVTCVASGGEGDAQIVTSSVDGKIRTYDLRTAQLLTEDIRHPITSFSLGHDNTTIASSCLDGSIRLWDRSSQNNASRTKIFQRMRNVHKGGNYKLDCAFTSNDKYIFSGSECGAVVVYMVASSNDGDGKTRGTKLERHTGPTCSVATCPQSQRPWLALSASYDGSAVVWASQEEAEHCLEG